MKSEDFKRIEEDLKRRKIPTIVKKAVSVMLDKQAREIVVLKLKDISDITDFLVICHGTSSRQNNAIATEIKKVLGKQFKNKPFGMEGEREADWILMDYVDFVIHIFSPENRKKYSIEKLWMDAKRYNFYPDQLSEG
jgi:ribosome-associated protein